ncbi:outer membrane beta-barrel protein [Fulvivirgaceae bacterium PWU4]|uniref:Outer membrane beta-barrel protein n=1 Tax=Chryseosolibacter histidini TaxID=2782349 RepID=A0AAP2DLQ9_9BACT|nr:TonB-dependent receptor [Chryseosolibacter histidini]MBT1698655.1 outer membrane beta-barrel protein [Chryseosolibacter histidini]
MLRSMLSFCLVLLVTFGFAQNGTISGTVTDSKSGETVVGANVVIQGTTVGSPTDIDGKFTIQNVKPGTYNLSVTFVTYKAHTIPDVVVEGGKITTIQVQMQEDVSELQEVVITGTREINNDISLLNAIKEAKLVVTGISAEQITRLPDNDAAQVMKRVPGITIVDNRFVMVRGVPERYNQVMINNAIAPSTEVDKRSFSFDMVPSGAIDQLLIFKSGTAEYPGDFAGGVIQVITKQAPAEEYLSFGLNFGYRSNTTFKNFLESKKGSTDLLGFDDGDRSLPNGFPTTKQLQSYNMNNRELPAAAALLSNDFDYTQKNALADAGLNFGLGKHFSIGKRIDASTLVALSYSNNYQAINNAPFKRYSNWDSDPETASAIQQNFSDNSYLHESKISLINNWQFNIGERSTVEFKNLAVQIGENKTMLREGTDAGGQGGFYNNYAYHYLSRFIYSGQLQGKTDLTSSASLNWVLGYNTINRNEPDFRRFRRIKDQGSDFYRMILPANSNPFDAGRFYSDLSDKGYAHGLSFEKKFGDGSEKRMPSVKAGYFIDYKERNFNARYITNVLPGSFGYRENELSVLPLSQIFDINNFYSFNSDNSVNPGFILREGTRPTDSYNGTSLTTAGFVSGSLPLGNFDLSGGIRVEYFDQKLNLYENTKQINNKVTSPLPFLNIAYNLSERSLVRAAYGRTVNRPEFREIAPFLFYQFEYNLNITGDTTLRTATIDNIDLRWELYPNPGEMVSVGAFYKKFKNPIEFIQENASGGLQFSYANAPEAQNYGIEVELRKSLASLGVSKFLRNTSVNLNASLIKSVVNFPDSLTFQQNKRSLQGQSPYVINTGIYYNDTEKGYSVNLAYNIFGNRIFSAGSVLYPTWIERPRHALDIQLAKTFGKLEVRLNIQNVLNSAYRIYQDNDENEKINEKVDDSIQEYKTGTLYGLSLGWKLAKD